MGLPQHDLPVGFRGYDRNLTNALLADLAAERETAERERDELRLKVEELAAELEEHRSRSQAIADALVTAQRVAEDLRGRAEEEIKAKRKVVDEERKRLADEGSTIKTEAHQEAAEIVREARIRADRLADEFVAALAEYRQQTDSFVDGTSSRLTSLVRELLERIPGSAPAPAPVEAEVAAEDEPPAETEAAAA